MNPLLAAFRLPVVLLRYRELLSAFVRRELKARIEGSILGRVWPVAQPILLFVIYYLIFSQILRIGFTDLIAPHGDTEAAAQWRSTFYLITGILPWTVLGESLSRGTGVVLENANLIKKIAFPSELLPIYQVVVYHVYFFLGFLILLALELAVNGSLPSALVYFPAMLLVQFAFISGLVMMLSAANVFVRDVMQAVPVLVTFWMFTTPVFYDLSAIPAPEGDVPGMLAAARQLMPYNPMAVLLSMYRSIFSYGMIPFPTGSLINLALIAGAVQWLGYAYFLRCKGRFADEV